MTRTWLLVWTGAVLFSLAQGQQTTESAKSKPQVLFVCEHGAAKSVIAAAYFNKLAEQRGLSERAIARGTQPDAAFSPAAVNGLKQDGFAVQSGKPTLVTYRDLDKSSRVVTLGCKLPATSNINSKIEHWDEVPSVSDDYEAARRAIQSRVEQLISELAAHKEP